MGYVLQTSRGGHELPISECEGFHLIALDLVEDAGDGETLMPAPGVTLGDISKALSREVQA